MVRYKMLARDVDATPIQYRTWVVENQPDLTASLYTGLKSGDNPLVDITAYAILDSNEVVDFNFPNALDWSAVKKVLPNYTCDGQFAIVDGYAYLFGGQNSNKILQTSLANPTDWVDTGATLPSNLAGSQLAIVNDYLYLFGGTTDTSYASATNSIYSAPIIDPLTWTNNGYLLPKNLHHSQLAIIDGYLYLYGGATQNGASSTILKASTSDPLTWSNVGNLPYPLYGSQLAIIDGYADGYVALFGGITADDETTSSIFAAPLSDPTNFNIEGALPYAAAFGQLVLIGDQGFLITPADTTVSQTRIFKCDLNDPFLTWVDSRQTVPGEISQSHLGIIYDRIFLYGGNGNTAIFANNQRLKYNLASSTVIKYGDTTRTEVVASSTLNLFQVIGFAPWRTDYGS